MKRLYLKKNVLSLTTGFLNFEIEYLRENEKVFEKFREPVPLSIFFCLG